MRLIASFLVDRPSVCLSVCRLSSVTYVLWLTHVLDQKLLLTAYRKSYMRNPLVPKWMTLTFL